MSRDRDPVVDRRADYLARTRGTRGFPWRVLVVARRDANLLENETVYKLGGELELEDTSWIRPVNTKSYEYFIDFAARYGIEYVILDEGWYVLGDLMKTTPEMDVPHLFEYAAGKGVRLIPWVVWKTLDEQFEEALDQFESWGHQGRFHAARRPVDGRLVRARRARRRGASAPGRLPRRLQARGPAPPLPERAHPRRSQGPRE